MGKSSIFQGMKRISETLVVLSLAVGCVVANAASAVPFSIVRTGVNPESGNTVTGQADFSFDGSSTLLVKLTNLSAPLTTNGDVLTGILFDSSIALTLTSVTVPEGTTIWTDKDTSSISPAGGTNWNGSWTDALLKSPPVGTYGAATTGFAGLFDAGQISLGTGSANYGVASNGTFDPPPPSSPNQFDLSTNMLVLAFASQSGQDLRNLVIDDVALLFGTDGTGVIVPIPAAAWLFASGLVGLVGVARKRSVRCTI